MFQTLVIIIALNLQGQDFLQEVLGVGEIVGDIKGDVGTGKYRN